MKSSRKKLQGLQARPALRVFAGILRCAASAPLLYPPGRSHLNDGEFSRRHHLPPAMFYCKSKQGYQPTLAYIVRGGSVRIRDLQALPRSRSRIKRRGFLTCPWAGGKLPGPVRLSGSSEENDRAIRFATCCF